jgi:hypothetical protein
MVEVSQIWRSGVGAGEGFVDIPDIAKTDPSGVLPDLIYRQAIAHFGEEGTAEFINLVGLYCMVSVTLNGFDVPIPEV